MAKVIMRYEVTNYKEIEMEVPDEVLQRCDGNQKGVGRVCGKGKNDQQ